MAKPKASTKKTPESGGASESVLAMALLGIMRKTFGDARLTEAMVNAAALIKDNLDPAHAKPLTKGLKAIAGMMKEGT